MRSPNELRRKTHSSLVATQNISTVTKVCENKSLYFYRNKNTHQSDIKLNFV